VFEKLRGRKSPEVLESEIETLKLEEEVVSKKADIAEREAVIKQLKKQYGPRWMQLLGLNKLTDTSTLKSMLQSAKRGMQTESSKLGSGTALSTSNQMAHLNKVLKA